MISHDMRSLVRHCLYWSFFLACSASAAADLRPLPYPHANVVTFANDVDMLEPDHGYRVHRLVNEKLGLPISDSIWIQGISPGESALFYDGNARRRDDSKINRHSTFSLLLRQWHRGNIDHIHGWQDDNIFQFRDVFASPPILKGGKLNLALQTSPHPAFSSPVIIKAYTCLRVKFDGEVPPDLAITLKGREGKTITLAASQNVARTTRHGDLGTLEVTMPWAAKARLDDYVPEFSLPGSVGIAMESKTCESSACNFRVHSVERDGYCGATVDYQRRELEKLGVLPFLYTSHGGNSYAQNFVPDGYRWTIARVPGSIYADAALANTFDTFASSQTDPSRLVDQLRALGVAAIWPIDNELKGGGVNGYYDPSERLPELSGLGKIDNIYRFDRTTFRHPGPSLKADAEQLSKAYPEFSSQDVKDVACANLTYCSYASNSGVAYLLAASMQRIAQARSNPIEHIWYTHFGSIDPEDKGKLVEGAFYASGVKWLAKLAARYYGMGESARGDGRIWVPPATTYLRYRIALSLLQKNKEAVSLVGSEIRIKPFLDKRTGQLFPDLRAGTRDLHGITFYVADPQKTTVSVGGRRISTFTRNPTDSSGRASITIVGNNAPTAIIGRADIKKRGVVSTTGGDLTSQLATDQEDITGGKLVAVRLRLTDKKGKVLFQPHDLQLWNTTHLSFSYRKIGPGRLRIDLQREDGRVISVVEASPGQEAEHQDASADWTLANEPSEHWRTETLALDALNFMPSVQAPTEKLNSALPLPIGKIEKISISLIDAEPGSSLELGGFYALRPSGNATSRAKGRMVAGRVNGPKDAGMANVEISLAGSAGLRRRTVTDAEGYYEFFDIPVNSTVTVMASSPGGRKQYPKIGSQFDILKDEAEIDVLMPNAEEPR